MSFSPVRKLSLWALVALVVSSMLDAGIFSFPATFARATGSLGALIAWSIAGGGMLMIALVFQRLATRKPELDAGVFAYAQAGFGTYMGFISALGFWAANCVGNVSYFVLVKSTLGTFFPIFGDGNTIPAIVAASLLLWTLHFFILQGGIRRATTVNTAATIAKVIIVVIFLGFIIWYFQFDIFVANLWTNGQAATAVADLSHLNDYGFVGHAAEIMEPAGDKALFFQVRHIMLVTVYVFLGIEGASVYSRYAKNREDVGIATVLGFLGVLCLFVLVTVLSYGVMPRLELAALRQPSMAGVLEELVGRRGAIFVSIGLLVSVMGAYLAWALFAAELLFIAARNGAMPAFLTRQNKAQVPSAALWTTNILVQTLLILTVLSSYAYGSALELTGALSLIPYLLVAAYGLKLAWTKETYGLNLHGRRKDLIIALIATSYAFLMLCAGGIRYFLLSAIIYTVGSILFFIARREKDGPVFVGVEKYIFATIATIASLALYSLYAGYIVI